MQVLPTLIMVGTKALMGSSLVGALVGIGASVLLSSLTGTDSIETPSTQATSYKTNPLELTFSSDAPRRMVYGRARLSGVVAYANVAGDGHEHLYMVVVIAAHPIEGVEQIYFDGEPGPDVAAGYYDYWVHDGTQTEADTTLVDLFEEWTLDCKLLGCSYAVVKLTYDQEIWTSGRPNIQFDVKGKKVYDPRSGETAWSCNAALCLTDFMTSVDGLGATNDEMDWDSIVAAADIADQTPDQASSGLCEGRYSTNGVIELSTKNGEIIEQLVACLAGAVIFCEGKYRIHAGAAVSPVDRPITEEDLRDGPTLQPKKSADQSFNTVKGTFLDSTNGWVYNDFPPVKGDAYIEEDGGVSRVKDVSLNFTTSPITAQRLATIILRKERLEKSIVLPCKWTCFNYEVWDVVPVRLAALGWVSKLFQVIEWELIPPSRNDPGGVNLTLVEYSDELYSDDMDLKPVDGGGTIITPDVTVPAPLAVLYATSGPSTLSSRGKPRIRFDWPASVDIYCTGYEIAYGKYPFNPAESDYKSVVGKNTVSFYTDELRGGDTVVGYVRVVNSYGKRSEPTAAASIVVKGSGAETPEALGGLTASDGTAGYVDLQWAAPASSEFLQTLIVWAKSAADYANGVLVAKVASPLSSARLRKEFEDGYYFAAFESDAGLIGGHDSVFVAGRDAGDVITSAGFSRFEGVLERGLWVKDRKAVPKSKRLASELGWEVFDVMVPEPYSTVEYWAKQTVYVEDGSLIPSGHVGWTRPRGIPGTLPVIGAAMRIAYSDETFYKQSSYDLLDNAFVTVGFQATHSEPQGVILEGFNGAIERKAA